MELTWETKFFNELNINELYTILQLREEVFTLEQHCFYQDMDGLDQKAAHLLGYDGEKLVAYARLFEFEEHYGSAAFGRVLIHKDYRKMKLGKILIDKILSEMERLFGEQKITISAQYYLLDFYKKFGFQPIGEPYDDAGVKHIRMEKEFV